MTEDPYRYFRIEAREILDQLGRDVIDLDGHGGTEVMLRVLRLAHTLKGAARVVKHGVIADLAHAIEDLVAPLREEGAQRSPELIRGVLGLLDRIAGEVSLLDSTRAAKASPGGAAEEAPLSLRAEVSELDGLIDGAAEAAIQVRALNKPVALVERAQHLADLLRAHLARDPGRSLTDAGGGRAASLMDELRGTLARLGRDLHAGVGRVESELSSLLDASEMLRLVPARALVGALERATWEAAHAVGRRVEFEAVGVETRIDASVLSTMLPALIQLVRNAVAHGIEPEAERMASGKPPAGRVRLEFGRTGMGLVFRCIDDGSGVDLDAVRRLAQARGLLGGGGQALGASEVLALLMRGGMTTMHVVTEMAGRGVGLDVVRDAVARIGGTCSVSTERGRGTVVELSMPAAVSSADVLIGIAGEMTVAIPRHAVVRAMSAGIRDDASSGPQPKMVVDGDLLPVVHLRQLLGQTASPAKGRVRTVLVVAGASGRVAMAVDRVAGAANVVLRPLPPLTVAPAIVGAVTLDREGNPQLVLAPEAIIAAAASGTRFAKVPEPTRHRLLVIDDSLTTRMLEKSILESAGYEVDLATSGNEALGMARAQPYGLFLVDVEMPGMDGFSFIEEAASDPRICDVPAILVSSRAAPEDRRRGEEVGARAYIAKNEFDQVRLLETIGRLVR